MSAHQLHRANPADSTSSPPASPTRRASTLPRRASFEPSSRHSLGGGGGGVASSSPRSQQYAETVLDGTHFRITRDQVFHAFSLLSDPARGGGPASRGSPTHCRQKDVRRRLESLFPGMSTKEYKLLVPDNERVTAQGVWELIVENADVLSTLEPYCNTDPADEVVKALGGAPGGASEGVVDAATLQRVFREMQLGDLTDAEVADVLEASDFDEDGVLSTEDVRALLGMYPTVLRTARSSHSVEGGGEAGSEEDSGGGG